MTKNSYSNFKYFETYDNDEIFLHDLDGVERIYLHGQNKIEFINWPDTLVYLHTSFEPNFSLLPVVLKELSFVMSREIGCGKIYKGDLPRDLEILYITFSGGTISFRTKEDDFDYYFFDERDNKFKGAYCEKI